MGAKKDVEFRYGLMAPVMKEIGKMIKPTVKVPLCMLTEMSIVVSGNTTKPMAMANMNTQTALYMSVTGLKTNSTDKV